jgi:hypothetical protein
MRIPNQIISFREVNEENDANFFWEADHGDNTIILQNSPMQFHNLSDRALVTLIEY